MARLAGSANVPPGGTPDREAFSLPSWLSAADRTNRTSRKRAALALWDCRPTFSDHVALAGGQKEIDNTYGGPEHKRHSHEHDNKDRNFPHGYTFHFPPASNRYLRRILIPIISLPRDPARIAVLEDACSCGISEAGTIGVACS